MDDLISRQAAIDAIDAIESEVADGDGFQYEKWRQYFCDLPSTELQPTCNILQPTCNQLATDCISRQDAIALMCKALHYNYEEGYAVAQMLELPSAEPGWIPVTERLPKPNEREEDGVERYYLIQNEFKDMMVAAYRENNSGHTWWEQMYAYKPSECKVIAWMPLPTPWKGENDG